VKKMEETKTEKGSRYTCGVCGLVVTVDEVCDCDKVCDLICCGELMEMEPPKRPSHFARVEELEKKKGKKKDAPVW
jgi:hypothetical protein